MNFNLLSLSGDNANPLALSPDSDNAFTFKNIFKIMGLLYKSIIILSEQ